MALLHDAADGCRDGLVVVFRRDGRVRDAYHVGPGFVEFRGGPETCGNAFIYELAVIVAEAALDEVQACILVDVVKAYAIHDVHEFVLGRDAPAGGADGLLGFAVLVKTTVFRAVVEVVVVAEVSARGVVQFQVFRHPNLAVDGGGLVGFLGAAYFVLARVVGARAIDVASRKREEKCCDSENDFFRHDFSF